MTLAMRANAVPLALDAWSLDRLMPLHLRLDAQGNFLSIGSTLAKIFQTIPVLGQAAEDHLVLCRPAATLTPDALRARLGGRLHLALKSDPTLVMRGIALPAADGGILINLSFGIWVVEAVRRHALTVADFSPTDLTVEMLYLVEAKSAVAAELLNLTLRLQGAKIAAEEQALTDTLTGLRNRRALDARIEGLLAAAQDFGLMHLDLDFFKQVNDTFGHAAGDHVLRTVAAILDAETRKSDLVARVGGDEFVLVFQGLAETDRLAQIAARIISLLEAPILFEGQPCRISASIGMTSTTHYAAPTADMMHADADDALYASKRAGRCRATFHTKKNLTHDRRAPH
jgi:diguanylate cyclase (GGDEF)-like protein